MMKLAVPILTTAVLIKCASCALWDPNYQYEVGPYIPDNRRISFPVSNPLLYQLTPNYEEEPRWPAESREVRQLKPSPPKMPTDTSTVPKNFNDEISEIIETLDKLSENRKDSHHELRAAENSIDSNFRNLRPPPYGGPPVPNRGSPSAPSSGPPSPKHESTSKSSLLDSDSLLKPLVPVEGRTVGKMGSLIELGLSLLTGGESKGIASILINGIVKPLLAAKGGLKPLINKVSIPMFALLLINVEVLITIWWLWEEDCPQPSYQTPAPAYTRNNVLKPVYPKPSYPPPLNYPSARIDNF